MAARRYGALVLIAFVCAMPNSHLAAETLTTLELDVAAQKPGVIVSTPLPKADSYRVRIINKLPDGKYSFTVTVKNKAVEALPLPSGFRSVAFAGPVPSGCEDVGALIERLDKAAKETDVRDVVRDLEDVPAGHCDSLASHLRDRLQKETTFMLPVPEVHSGQDVVIQVTKPTQDANGKPQTAQWTRTFEGEARGSWRTSYGFAFIADYFARNETFRSEAGPSAGQYTITKDDSRSRLRFVPSVMFSWLPTARENQTFAFALSAGLGFDLTRPVVFVSPVGVIYNQNVSLQIGLAVLPIDKLKGSYDENQIITENLTPEQLREDQSKSFGLNPYFSVSFNFASNPFGGGKKDEAKK